MNVALLDADRPAIRASISWKRAHRGSWLPLCAVSVGMGEKQSVVLTLEPDPKARATAGSALPAADRASSTTTMGRCSPRVPPLREPDTAASGEAPKRNLTAAYIGWAAGGTAVAVGSVFGLLAFKGKSDLDEQCAQNVCPDSSADRLHSARRDSTVATVLMAAGGAGLAIGTIVYFSAGPEEASASRQRRSAQPTYGRGAGPSLDRPGEVGLSGEF
jgi:hypothetical protein